MPVDFAGQEAGNCQIAARTTQRDARGVTGGEEGPMRDISHFSLASVVAFGLAAILPSLADAQQVGPKDIGGVVTGPSGPEAGVWVIAETSDLPSRFAKIVVTDD